MPLMFISGLVMAIASSLAFVPPLQSATRLRSTGLTVAPRGRHTTPEKSEDDLWRSPVVSAALLPFLISAPAEARGGDDIAGAFVAYGHYLAMIVSTLCLTTERLTIKPGMTKEEETRMAIADFVYGLSGLLVVVTGYLRASQYGKGSDFYEHEPIFWLKLTLVAIAGACSFFVTATIVKRAIAQKDAGDAPIAPVSPKLAARLTSIINAELLAIGAIPLTATLMARGVGYIEWLPWQAGAAPAVLALFGLGFKYIKEALDWKEDDVEEVSA